jgi:Zn-dependent peptidase ImmA (M78 family)
MRRRRAPLPRAVLAAQTVHSLRRISSPEEIDLKALIADHGVTLRRDSIGNAEGRLVRSGRRGVMTIDHQAFLSEKWLFVGAHELGHFLLHEYIEELSCFWKRAATREARSRGFLDEAAASNFATELLLPIAMVLSRYDRAASPMERARSLASCFGTSLPTTALRVLDFTEEPCAVAYSERGVVSWCTATPAFRVNVRDGARVPEGSEARGKRSVRAGAWGHASAGVEGLIEESVKLEPFDAVVTMLTHDTNAQCAAFAAV